ncbi:hypothetical protein ACWEOZ_12345 [Actinoplanes sp. NPDC004185]
MDPVHVLGWFPDTAAALTFAGLAVADPGFNFLGTARWYRWPTLAARPELPVWVSTGATVQQAGHLVELAGGRVLVIRDDRVIRVGGQGRHPDPIPAHGSELEPGEFGPAAMLDGCPRSPVTTHTARELAVFAPGTLARWVLRRAYDLGSAQVSRAVWRPVLGGRQMTGLRLRLSVGHPGAAGYLLDLAELPGVLVGQPVEGADDFWTDIRYRFPSVVGALRALVPTGGRWLVSERLWEFAAEPLVDATDLLDPPRADPLHDERLPGSAPTSAERTRVQVRLSQTADQRIDAVLVTDQQLALVRRYLETTPTDHAARLILGPGRHLLLGAGSDDLGQVPVGVPVRRLGPGPLYVESGCALRPAVPASARAGLFGLRDDVVVVATRAGTVRLDRAHTCPAWTLWLDAPPPVTGELSAAALGLLQRLSAVGHEPADPLPAGPEPADRARLLDHAYDLLEAGSWAASAEYFEAAGEHRRAANLYRRAATEP